MDVDEVESGHTDTSSGETISNPLSIPGGNEKKTSKRYFKSQSLMLRQYTTAQARSRNTYRTVAEPLLYQAVNVFLSDAVIIAPDSSMSKGHFANLVALVQSSSNIGPLPFALEAVALASLASRTCNSDVQLEATRRYTISINRLRMTNLNSNSDPLCIIACIMLLGLYEVHP
jgi:hypothetical protein